MDFLGITMDALKRIFLTENALLKHVSLFALTGILALNSANMKTLTNFSSTASDVSHVFWGGLLAVAVSIYIVGYSIKFMHNCFDFETPDILPDIDLNPFGIFLSALPLILLWIVYVVLICFAGMIPFLGWVLVLVFIPVISIFLQFIYIAYSKEYMANGLFNLFIPFTFARYSVGSMFLFGILFIPLYIVIFIPIFILAFIIGFMGLSNSEFIIWLGSILSGYLTFIVQLAWTYCMVQVYREKIEPNMDLD